MTTVGRTYRFRATHSLPDFPEPWCFSHQHDYTVEVEAEGGTPTDLLDERWEAVGVHEVRDLNEIWDPSTVERIAEDLLEHFGPPTLRVTVWEDRARFGTARLGCSS